MQAGAACAKCYYWEEAPDYEHGRCRKALPAFHGQASGDQPPQEGGKKGKGKVSSLLPADPLPPLAAVWPITLPTDWCGDYRHDGDRDAVLAARQPAP